MTTGLKEKAVKGVFWNLTEKVGVQGLKFVLGIVLARLLMPEDYGLIGIVTVFFVIAQVFIESGFGTAYVQKKEINKDDANTVFYSNLLLSVFAYILFWFLAPYISAFYDQTELIKLIRIMGIVLLINAFNVIQMAQLTRAIDFKRKTKITLVASIAGGVLGISSAYYGLGVWALVIQNITSRLVTTTGLWITSKWMPSLTFSKESFREMFSFGLWILLANVTQKLFDNIYTLTIGKFFPMSYLGFYTKAKSFQKLTSEQVSGAVSAVAFPVFSEIQLNKPKLKAGIEKFLQSTMFFLIPLLCTLIAIAKPFVIILLTEKWAPMIPYLQLLSVVGILYPIHLVNVQVLLAQGKSNLSFRITIVKNAFRVANIIIMYRFGVINIILGEIVVSFIALIINTYYTKRLVHYGLFEQLRSISKLLMAGGISLILGFSVNIVSQSLWFHFIGGTILSVVSFYLFQYVFNREMFNNILKLRQIFK